MMIAAAANNKLARTSTPGGAASRELDNAVTVVTPTPVRGYRRPF